MVHDYNCITPVSPPRGPDVVVIGMVRDQQPRSTLDRAIRPHYRLHHSDPVRLLHYLTTLFQTSKEFGCKLDPFPMAAE